MKGFILACFLLVVARGAEALPSIGSEGDSPVSIHQVALSDVPQAVWYLYFLQPDCSTGLLPRIEIMAFPTHGEIQSRPVKGHTAYPLSDQRSACNERLTPMTAISYAPVDGFIGSDAFALKGIFPSEMTKRLDFSVKLDSAPVSGRLLSVGIHTLVRADPAQPLKIGGRYYPKESLRAKEQGKCIVFLTVGADGVLRDASLQQSTGYSRLDQACLDAVAGGHLIPATEDGVPVEAKIPLPIVWALGG